MPVTQPAVDMQHAVRPLWFLLGAWCLLSIAVMAVYVERYHFRANMIPLHVALVATGLLVALAPCALLSFAPAGRTARRLLTAAILGTTHFLLIAYYALLFIGWETWNQVISLEILKAYSRQLPDLLQALPVSVPLSLSVLLDAFAIVALPYWLASGRLSDALGAARQCAVRQYRAWTVPWRLTLLVSCLIVAPSLLGYAFWTHRALAISMNEPLYQTAFGAAAKFQSMPLNPENGVRALMDRRFAEEYAPPTTFAGKNLVVITVDALRADQMGIYGFERETTPFLSALHRAGKIARIDRTFSVCGESFCGLLAVLTSKYWHQATRQNFSLPDVLKRLGYRVSFFLSGDHTHFYGLRDAYGGSIDDFRDGSNSSRYMNDDYNVLDWLQQMQPAPQTPQFLFIHLMSVHSLGTRHAEYRKWEPSKIHIRPSLAPETLRPYINNYHNGILQMDSVVERVFKLLREKKLLDDAVVVITADHGELLGENGNFGHQEQRPVEPLLRIPLLIYDSEGVRYPARPMASQVDVAPTLLDRIRAPIPGNWAGESINLPPQRAFVYAQTESSRAVITADGGALYKYYYDRDTGAERLFNLSHDPIERDDVFRRAAPGLVAKMRSGLRSAYGVPSAADQQ